MKRFIAIIFSLTFILTGCAGMGGGLLKEPVSTPPAISPPASPPPPLSSQKPFNLEEYVGASGAVVVRAFSCLTGGTTGCLDKIPVAQITNGDMALVTVSNAAYIYQFNSAATDAEASPTYVRPDDYSSGGVWYLVTIRGVGLDTGGSADPTITLQDSDNAAGTAKVYGVSSGGSNDIILYLGVEIAGTTTDFIEVDGVSETVDILKPVVSTGAITPATAGGAALGSATAEWDHLYLHDSAVVYGQADQSATLTSSASKWTANNFDVTGDLGVGDDFSLTSDGAIINIGASNDVVVTHSTNLLTITGGDLAMGADPGDSGALRLSNNTAISWEPSTPGTDIFIALDNSDILQVGQNAANIYLGTSGTGNVQVTGDLTVLGSDVSVGAAGVKLTGDGDGAITFLGLGGGYDEDLTLNLDDVENSIGVSSSTGVSQIDFGAITLLTTGSIGGTANEVAGIYLADSAVIYGQNDQTATLTSSASMWTANNFGVTTQFKLPSSNADPTATAGYLRHDSTITNFTNGGLVYYNGAAIKQVVDMTTATAQACTDDQVVAYDADNDLWYCKTDANSGGTPTVITVADTTDSTSYVALFESATGDLGPKTDAAITYDASTGVMGVGGITVADSGILTFDESAADPNDADIQLSATDGVFKIAAANGANNEDLTIDLDQTSNTAIITSSTGVTDVSLSALNLATTGQVTGRIYVISKSADYTLGTDSAKELYGSMVLVTATATITAPEVTVAADAGKSFCVYSTTAAAVHVDVHSNDRTILNGTALSNGDKVTSASGAGDYICFICDSASGWTTLGRSGTWTDGN